MNIYLICKHRKLKNGLSYVVYAECIVLKPFTNKQIASKVINDLNKRSKKYWYSIKKLEVAI